MRWDLDSPGENLNCIRSSLALIEEELGKSDLADSYRAKLEDWKIQLEQEREDLLADPEEV